MTNGLAGGALLASLALARGLASASESAVYVAGRELPGLCVSRLLLGVSCPGCGMTRSALLTLGGDLPAALAVNPAGPLLVMALALFGVQLLASALRGGGRRHLARTASAYAVVVAAVMIIHWVSDLVRT